MTDLHKRLIVAAAILVLAVIPLFATNDYQLRLVCIMAINTLAVVGLNFVKGFAGQVSVGQHGMVAVGGYASALLSANLGWPVWLSIPAAMVVAAIAGLIIGLPSLRVQGAYLAIATLGFAESLRIVLNSWDWAGSSLGLSHVPPLSVGSLVFATPRAFYYIVVGITAIAIWISYNLAGSAFGRALLAIREDPLAASVGGVNLRRYKLMAFVLSAVLAGLSGALMGHIDGFVHPQNYTLLLMVMLLLMLVLGGMGSIGGSIIGAVVVTLLFDLTRAYIGIQMMLFSGILILSVRFFPSGLVGLLRKVAEPRRAPVQQQLIPGE